MHETQRTSDGGSARTLLIAAGIATAIVAPICAALVGLITFALAALPAAEIGMEGAVVAALMALLIFAGLPAIALGYGVFAYRAGQYRPAFVSAIIALITAALPATLLFVLSFGIGLFFTPASEELPLRPPPPELQAPP